MSVVSYTLPPTTRDVGFKSSAPAAISKSKPVPRNVSNGGDALMSLDGPDEKLEDGDELSKSYIPLSLARAKMAVLSTELANMKSKHLTLMDEIAQRYEKMTLASRAHFEGIVDEVKARASLRLKENKATMEELREEIVLIQEAQAQKNAQYRQEIKAAVKEQGRLQQELLDAQNEAANLQKRHEEESVRFEQRKAEMEALMDRVPREEHVALQTELTELQQKQAAESASAAEKIAALEQEAQDNKSALEALNVTHLSLQEQHTASAAALAAKEDELALARTEVEDTKAALAAAESQVSASDESTKAMQERLTEQEARAATLETQLLTAQALVGTGGGGSSGSGEDGDGPARIVMIPDPELQSNVRRLEGEMNKLLRENADLTRVLLEREEAVAASNEALVKAKTLGTQTSIRLASGAAAAASLGGEDDAEEEEVSEEVDAPSEYEDQDVEEQFEEEVSVPAPAAASADEPGSPAPADPRREALVSQLAEADSTLSAHGASIAALERELKPKVVDYKTRLAEFKGDTERKELEAALGFDRIVEEDGSEHELRPADLSSLSSMLSLNEAVATQKPILAARVLVLRPRKKELDDNKVLLSDLKNTISELKAAGTDPEAVKAKEAEFMALRNSMQADATAFRDEYADYGAKLNELKAQETELQALFVKFKIDADHAEDKPRKLSADKTAQIQRLVDLINNKGKERDALKALAEEVNTKNTQLKALKAEREVAQTAQKTLQAELDELPPPPAAASSSAASSSGATIKVKRLSTRTVTKRVKLPARKQIVTRKVKKAGGGRSAASASSATGEAHVPATLLNSLKPIHLRDKGKYTAREFTPVTPTVFKAPVNDAAGAGSVAPASSSSSSAGDPALQAKYDKLTARASKLESELDALRQSSSHSTDALAAKENELSQLREQIRILTEENPDERVSALAAQLAQQRAEVDATHQAHASRLAEVAATGSAARAELATKADEVAKLKSEVQNLKEKVRSAKAEARAAASSGGGGGSSVAVSGGGGGGGGADPALVAELEGKVSSLEESLESTTAERDAHLASIASLQARIAELEADVAAHTGSLSEQLAAREAELTAAHASRISELEAQITESTEKLRITKKKAKELHEALTAETAKREGLETNVTELTATIAGMEAETAEARASVAGLKGEIAQREGVISTKVGEINGLLEVKSKLEGEVAFLAERNAEEVKRRKEFQFKYEDAKGKVRVYARVRPFSKQEIKDEEKTLLRPGTNEWTLCINETQKNYQGIVTDNWRPIEFDHVFQFGLENTKGNASQAEIFEETKIFAELSVQGINCCVFAYGQSGTGKTFTMAGIKPNEANGFTRDLLGLKPRMIERVYEMKQQLRKTHDIDISCYMLEIYLNHLEDVFWKLQTQQKYQGKEKSKWPEPPELKVRVDAKRKVTVDNSVILKFETGAEMQEFCDAAEMTRRVRKTGLNEESSRSHLIFALICTSTDKKTGKKTTGKLSLVDLAGSERAEKTSVEGLSKAARAAMMEEGIAINESLRMLKSVFRILGEANKPLAKGQKAEIVQYRGNMLTELMQDSLGGNAKTLMFVNVGPAASNISESVDSLAYGDLVKNITNEKVSADADLEEQLRFLQVQLRAYEAKFGALDA